MAIYSGGMMSRKMRKNGYYAAFDYAVSEYATRGNYPIHVYYVDSEETVFLTTLHTTRRNEVEKTVKAWLDNLYKRVYTTRNGCEYYIEVSPFKNFFTVYAWQHKLDTYEYKILFSVDIFVNSFTENMYFDVTNDYIKHDKPINAAFQLFDSALAFAYSWCFEAFENHIDSTGN